LENHKHWFCSDDLNRCIGGTSLKFVVAKLVVPTVWPIQEGINLTQNELIILEEVGFYFDHLHKSNSWSLFGSQSSCSSNSHVPTIVNCPNLVRPFDASCWPTTCGGKKVRWPLVLKMTQQHINNWEASILLLQCIVFFVVDVPSPRYGQIYNILSNDKCYNVTIGNFLGCSFVYFVTMLVGFLNGLGTYVQCKHVYHVLKSIMFYGLTENFIHYYTWSWEEVQCLLQHFKVLGL
jgi:hypothetical protein